MSYLARFSPKLRWLSRVPSALALTVMPGADLCCARAIKSASPLGLGLNRNDLIMIIAPAAPQKIIAIIKILYRRELLIVLSNTLLGVCHFGRADFPRMFPNKPIPMRTVI